ncbi:AMIN-like domain-containing (lipo)protein [Ornithinimicrobium pekingense]|uniref:AMIN-like domain-containing protein n=1 Tax=Ornithinimicrobium pekingense TaxID=384677 RepID=A0ABQ2F6B5_9MICO|nr:hypothetical protein [Ornithinimicrobium pekingense]GGK57052.1 hypothetical protein GCM10011509_01770 [Ornithinimicrobium pekingense]
MGTRRTRRQLTALAAAAALAAGLGAPASALAGPATTLATTARPYCGITWGSLAKANAVSHTTGTLSGVRSGRHDCFDRLVLDVAKVPRSLSYDVRYVTTVREDGSGRAVPLKGDADLRIVLRAPAYDDQGRATFTPRSRTNVVDVTGYSTFRQVAWAGSFEGQTTLGLGVRARLPMRVFVLDGPGDGARLVIDVAHRW